MKDSFKFKAIGRIAGIITLTVLIAFFVPGCGGGAGGGNGTLTPITGFTWTPTMGLELGNANVAAGAVVGTFGNVVGGTGTSFTFSLVSGTGSGDNHLFTIHNNQLRVGTAALTEARQYSVRVQVSDGEAAFSQALSLTVYAVGEISSFSLTTYDPLLVSEMISGMELGYFEAAGGTGFVFTLVSGTGSTDNALFVINSNQLIVGSSNLAAREYSIRARVSNAQGAHREEVFTFEVFDELEIITQPTSGRLTITGLADFSGKYVFAIGGMSCSDCLPLGDESGCENCITLFAAAGIDGDAGTITTGAILDAQAANLHVWQATIDGAVLAFNNFDGTGFAAFQIWVLEDPAFNFDDLLTEDNELVVYAIGYAVANFVSGIASAEFVKDENGGGDINWPPAEVLEEFGLAGMFVPGGPPQASDVYWIRLQHNGEELQINFEGTLTTRNAVENWFTGNDWELAGSESGEFGGTVFSAYEYRKDGFSAHFGYSIYNDSYTFSIKVGPAPQNIDWPSAEILAQFGLAGMFVPDGPPDVTNIWTGIWGEGADEELAVIFKGTEATRNALIGWFEGNDWTLDNFESDTDGMFIWRDYFYSTEGFWVHVHYTIESGNYSFSLNAGFSQD